MLAAKEGHLNVVRKLITSGARLDVVDKVNSLSTMGIQCTHLHAQHVTMLCSSCQPTVTCVVTVSLQLPLLDMYLLSYTWEASPDSYRNFHQLVSHILLATDRLHNCNICHGTFFN